MWSVALVLIYSSVAQAIVGGIIADGPVTGFAQLLSVDQSTLVCGATLVSPTHAVTMASCFRSLTATLTVAVGGLGVSPRRQVTHVWLHPSFVSPSPSSPSVVDLAVFTFSPAATFAGYSLVSSGTSLPDLAETGSVAGFGNTVASVNGSSVPHWKNNALPMIAEILLKNASHCRSLASDAGVELDAHFSCAGGSGVDVCAGDEGVGLVVNGQLAGIFLGTHLPPFAKGLQPPCGGDGQVALITDFSLCLSCQNLVVGAITGNVSLAGTTPVVVGITPTLTPTPTPFPASAMFGIIVICVLFVIIALSFLPCLIRRGVFCCCCYQYRMRLLENEGVGGGGGGRASGAAGNGGPMDEVFQQIEMQKTSEKLPPASPPIFQEQGELVPEAAVSLAKFDDQPIEYKVQ